MWEDISSGLIASLGGYPRALNIISNFRAEFHRAFAYSWRLCCWIITQFITFFITVPRPMEIVKIVLPLQGESTLRVLRPLICTLVSRTVLNAWFWHLFEHPFEDLGGGESSKSLKPLPTGSLESTKSAKILTAKQNPTAPQRGSTCCEAIRLGLRLSKSVPIIDGHMQKTSHQRC